WGDRYEYGAQLLAFAVLATVGVVALALWALRGQPEKDAPEPASQPTSTAFWLLFLGFIGALIAAIASGPASPHGEAPKIARLAWTVPAVLMLPFVALYAGTLMRGWSRRAG